MYIQLLYLFLNNVIHKYNYTHLAFKNNVITSGFRKNINAERPADVKIKNIWKLKYLQYKMYIIIYSERNWMYENKIVISLNILKKFGFHLDIIETIKLTFVRFRAANV